FRDPNQAGKLVQFTATRPTKREAEKALAELVLKRDRGRLIRGSQTFGMAATKWRLAKEQTAAPSSLLRWDVALRTHLLPAFKDTPLRKITPDALDSYYAGKRRAGLADNTVRWQHDLLSNILRYTVRTLGWLEDNPA